MEQLYLDYNATTPTKPEVVQIISEALQEAGNPSSVHSFGRRSRELIEQSRDSLAEMVGASLKVMDHDTSLMRGDKPWCFTNLKNGQGVEDVVDFLYKQIPNE